ncbi:UNVERIFIED_CONTAM: hypothetical protein FKN15_037872 [Acipenser sinensis]
MVTFEQLNMSSQIVNVFICFTCINFYLLEDDDAFQPAGRHDKHFYIQNWREKEAQAKKAEFIREAEKLKKQIAKLEKDQNAHLYVKKKDVRNEFGTLEDLELKLTNSRTMEIVEKLKEIMEEVENAINAFKEEQRQSYEELMKEEKNSSQEIIALEKKFETWALAVSAAPKNCPSLLAKVPLAKTIDDDLPAEVVEFEKFLQQTGGRQGGWDDYDHQNFLKVWTKHNGKTGYMKEALLYLPGRTQEDIQLHENWYQEFLFLEESKKEAIQKWKAKKQLEKEELLKQKDKSEEELRQEQLAHVEAQRQKMEQERKERQTRLHTWKKQKEQERTMEEKQQLREEAEKRRKATEEQQRQLEDLHKLEAKLLEKRAKEEEAAEREDRLAKLKEKVEVHISRDPSRLWRPTKGWEERTKQIGPTGGGPLLHIPQRLN